MCGIAGIYSATGVARHDLSRQIQEMCSHLVHRGPDDSGYYVRDRIALGHRRLSIIDLETGRQPIFNEDQTKCVIFNGEIYNYKELRTTLVANGHTFATNTDTEVIVHAYEEWGEQCVTKLNGMFAFAIWDATAEMLFLARDRFGEKPLFYACLDGRLVFASELKALRAVYHGTAPLNWEALASYFLWSYIPAPLTIYEGISKLLPGHYLTIQHGILRIEQYWDLVFEPNRQRGERQTIDECMALLQDSVRLRMVSDVPLGAFLSGGLDSGAVVSLMSRLNTGP